VTEREVRCSDIPSEWKERLARKACPVCGKERIDFDGRHRGYEPHREPGTFLGGTPCCSPACTDLYWKTHKTWQQHREQIFKERKGICAKCGYDLTKYPAWDGDPRLPTSRFIQGRSWVLDHIVPIAMGGAMWDPQNHQILCEICNKEKTAKDLGKIAQWKKLNLPDASGTKQGTLEV